MVKLTAWLGACALLAGSVAALGTNYEHDAKTTYCWAIPQPTNKTKLTEDDRTPDYAGPDNCPFALTVTLSNSTVHAFEAVTVQWTVTAQFTTASNPVNQTKIYFGKDSTGKQAQIVHSNVHSCVFGTGCDPFNDGKQLVDKTVNKVANFTDNAAIFNDTMTFIEPGEYSVLAHIILPNAGAASRFDYAVYSKLVVLAATAAPAPTSPTTAPEVVTPAPASAKSSGLSQEATVGIIVGGIVAVVALAVVAVVLRRRKNPANNNYHPAPVSDVHDGGNNKMYHSDVTMTNSTTGFESAWGGDKPHSSTLDNTNQSNQSNGSSGYAAATTTGAFSYETGSTFGKAMQMQDLAASTQSVTTTGRKKRQDSDVEL